MKSKKVKVNITLSEWVLLSIDKHARLMGLSRSAYITMLENDVNERTKSYLERYQNEE